MESGGIAMIFFDDRMRIQKYLNRLKWRAKNNIKSKGYMWDLEFKLKKNSFKYSLEKIRPISASTSSYTFLPSTARQWPCPTNSPPRVSWSAPSPPFPPRLL